MMGDRGRIVVPLELRERLQLEPGAAMLMLDTPQGIVLTTRDQAKQLIRDQLRGGALVDELLSERREQAAADDAT